jgi:hypothetical protein
VLVRSSENGTLVLEIETSPERGFVMEEIRLIAKWRNDKTALLSVLSDKWGIPALPRALEIKDRLFQEDTDIVEIELQFSPIIDKGVRK